MKDFLTFRKMLSPLLIQILFWLAIVFFIAIAVRDVIHAEYIVALQVIVLGPLVSRIICELLILFFRINSQIDEIRQKLT